jgi:hypothetical protein
MKLLVLYSYSKFSFWVEYIQMHWLVASSCICMIRVDNPLCCSSVTNEESRPTSGKFVKFVLTFSLSLNFRLPQIYAVTCVKSQWYITYRTVLYCSRVISVGMATRLWDRRLRVQVSILRRVWALSSLLFSGTGGTFPGVQVQGQKTFPYLHLVLKFSKATAASPLPLTSRLWCWCSVRLEPCHHSPSPPGCGADV